MVRSPCRSLLAISLVFFTVTTDVHARQTNPADLAQARRLVGQSRQLLRDAHRRDPHGFGGHEAKAAELLRRAALQLNEAHTFRIYNADRPSHPAHRATRRSGHHLISKGVQQRMSG
ncbi:hypothetical protein [Caballeronia udeis]|uniref:hypothetical protein n=1 Tax=Caballeronia udeis TaxID=1232866 RepID=UPI00078160CB|nr:hypothetical protein [Caballeronia udeis]